MDLEKRHCCCCILLPDGVLLLGLYGVCVHTGLLIVQCIYGRPLTPLADEQVGLVDEMVLHPTLIALHIIGIVVNALLVYGAHHYKKKLLLPWLIGQALLATLLAVSAVYYLVVFPHANCTPADYSDYVQCNVLLWHVVVMIIGLLILVYYFYVVHEFLAQLLFESSVSKALNENLSVVVEEVHLEGDNDDEREGVKKPPPIPPPKPKISLPALTSIEEPGTETIPVPEKRRVRIREPSPAGD